MSSEPEKKEETIYYEALKITSPQERSDFLKKACGEDSLLLSRVQALLKANEEAGDFLQSPPFVDAEVTLDEAPLHEGAGTVIGHYKLLEKIGEGGMAVVYMAEQEHPIRRKVALKVIKLGMDTKRVIARFEAERQALAIMDHPNIAKVFDAGTTETGRPYFVMELVKGVSITEYCDKNESDTRQRLDLFISVCNAVQHAHQKGIIHRDIKPSNVMVTLQDGKPLIKVIDFGIAKATNQQLTEKTLFTRYAQMIGTPAYMSPEQAEMSALDIDTRTDIYSLGVLLYELLTGVTPFDAEKLRAAGYNEIQRVIREQEPPKPSTRLSTLGEELTIVAKRHHCSPELLRKLVRGDLDWIVMKSLEKNRNRRYETANELVGDIQRHLNHEPVKAAAPSFYYKLHKFVRRNRVAVLTSATIITAIVLGLITSTVLYFQAEKARENETAARLEATQQRDRAIVAEAEAVRQRDSAQTQRERAEGNFQMARDAVDEMIQVAEHKLAVAPGMEQVRRELLEKAQIFYAGFLQDNIGDLEIREEIGRAYKQLGDINKELGQYEQAEQAYRKAIEVFGELTDEFPDEENYRMELAISENALGFVLQELGLHEEADDAYRTGIEVSGALAADFPNEPDYLDVLFDSHFSRGLLLVSVGRYEEAEQAYRQALEIREKLGADFSVLPHGVTAITHLHWRLSELLNEMGRRQEAAEVLHQAVANLEKLVTESPDEPKYHAELARRLDTLRWLLRESRHLEPELMTKAMSHTLRAVELDPMETLYRRELASQSELLGGALVALNRHDEARQTYEQAIALLENLLNVAPSCRYELLMILVDLAYLLENTGRTEEAQVVYSRAETVRRELLSRFPNLPYDNREASATFDGHVNAFVEYRVRITTVGEYRLYVRGAGHDLKSDSFIAWIEELCDGPGGPIADCYRYEPRADADFGTGVWQGSASREGGGYNIGSERFGTTIWSIRVPGDYTIHVVGREDGAAIDALAFQLATLPAPKGQGPEESQVIKGRVFLEVGGQMVAEAENFSSRTPRKGNWLIIPGEDPGDVAHKNFRGAGYIQALPDRTLSFEERLDYCTRAIEARPNEATAYDQRGDLYLRLGQWNEAISDFTKAIELGSDNFSVLNEIAWLLATSQEYGLRDGKKAVEYATKACELTDWENPMIVDTLAAAYAEVGDFTEAVKWQKKAVEFLSEEDPHGILGGVELRLKLYEAGKPYR